MQNPITYRALMGAAHEDRFDLIELMARVRASHWVVASVLILLVDYLTGPFIQFPILFSIPVVIATAAQGVIAGSIVATLRPHGSWNGSIPALMSLFWLDLLRCSIRLSCSVATSKCSREFSQCAAFASESVRREGSGDNSRLTSRSAPALYSAIPFASNAPGPTIRV